MSRKRIFTIQFLLFFLLAPTLIFGQKLYFMYIQTEDWQGFYMRQNNVIHSSSTIGYLILPRLTDTTYNFIIGFPQNKYPEQRFTVPMNSRDRGFLLKNFGQKGWGLFDLQSAEVIMSGNSSAMIDEGPREKIKEITAFTGALVQATGDETLLDVPVVKTETKIAGPSNDTGLRLEMTLVKTDTPKTVLGNIVQENKPVSDQKPLTDSATSTVVKEEKTIPAADNTAIAEKKNDQPVSPVTDTLTENKPVEKKENPATSLNYLPTTVNKFSESSTTLGFGLVYLDHYENGVTDTIRLLIPNPVTENTEIKKPDPVKQKFLDMPADTTAATSTMIQVNKDTSATNSAPKQVEKPCNAADENDFFLLRKNMAGANGNDPMLAEAGKYFQVKCFTVQQIRNLSVLFLDDKGKYEFFKAAYPHISNQESFNKLQGQLTEDYYIDLFKSIADH